MPTAIRTSVINLALLAICACLGCVHTSPGVRYEFATGPLTAGQAQLRDELRSDVEKLAVDIGPRSGSQSLAQVIAAEKWIIERLEGMGLGSARDVVTLGSVDVANIEVVFPGNELPDEIIVIGGHYDTVPDSPGANDNASAVAMLLATAKRLKEKPMARTVKLLFFVNEENPFTGGVQMGSRVYAEGCRARGDNIVMMMSIDSIGYYSNEPDTQKFPWLVSWRFPDEANFVAFVTNEDHKMLLDAVVAVFQEHSHFPATGVASTAKDVYRSDHAPFLWQDYPALLMSDTSEGRDDAYHTPGDTPDRLNYDAMARVADGLIKTVQALAAASTTLP